MYYTVSLTGAQGYERKFGGEGLLRLDIAWEIGYDDGQRRCAIHAETGAGDS